ncbi:carboxypeptidase-like regulatory domain-containing protein [Halosquirtibacter xylanolyticus]|uniref:alpha-2-macroglobulin family protein n=1 Tax=Halosquirtibacter xylanolyticus TaxID=3374599 RepID=UPI003747CE79|nr:carboxypeptidase-like regulatory domain-containing protein [Prolixibacteraceae bacterium]
MRDFKALIRSVLKYTLFLISFLSNAIVFAQQPKEVPNQSVYTYLFKINEKEAKALYLRSHPPKNEMYHTLVDSFLTDGGYLNCLPEGHYIMSCPNLNGLETSVFSQSNIFAKVLDNDRDLILQIYSLDGKLIDNALVKVGNRKINYNQDTKSFVDYKSTKKGLVSIEYDGFTSFYSLSYGQLRYSSYYRPFNLRRNYYCMTNLFRKKYISYNGYLVFNKPIYRPKDTVKYKAFIVDKKGIPVKKDLNVLLRNYPDRKMISTLSPYEDGAYEGEFVLNDSLKLKLDADYSLELRDKDQSYIRNTFKYEDYQLNKSHFEVSLPRTKYYCEDVLLDLLAQDENNLNLMDATVEIVVTPKRVSRLFDKQGVIGDTLFTTTTELMTRGKTRISIPYTALPKANISCDVTVKMVTSDGETMVKLARFDYYHEMSELSYRFKNDSILVEYLVNGKPVEKNVTVTVLDQFNNDQQIASNNTPFCFPLQTIHRSYKISSDSISKRINMSRLSSRVDCFTYRDMDSLMVKVYNPYKIPFRYTILAKDKIVQEGYGKTLHFKELNPRKENYSVSLQYLWAGKVLKKNLDIRYNADQLNLLVKQPRLVYPGQKSKIEVVVKDPKGLPVENVDLTAYGVTKKFNAPAPQVPLLGKSKKTKLKSKSHEMHKKYESHTSYLDYPFWQKKAGLDTLLYYQVYYPGNDVFSYEYTPLDTITQFAPYVMHNGKRQDVRVVYVDGVPVYFNWMSGSNPYSFRIDPGYHQIKMRLDRYEIEVDSVLFNQGKKLIFSMDMMGSAKNVTRTKTKKYFTPEEITLFSKYIQSYHHVVADRLSYIQSGSDILMLDNKIKKGAWPKYVGPIHNVDLQLYIEGNKPQSFTFDPHIRYGFLKNRMLKYELYSNVCYDKLDSYQANDLFDEVLTQRKIDLLYKSHQISVRNSPVEFLSLIKRNGAARLVLIASRNEKFNPERPDKLVLLNEEDSTYHRVFEYHDHLTIDRLKEGNYRVVLFYKDQKYHIVTPIKVTSLGLSYRKYDLPILYKEDAYSSYIQSLVDLGVENSKVIERILPNNTASLYLPIQKYHTKSHVPNSYYCISGYVYDKKSKEPLSGVTIMSEDKAITTKSDDNGFYRLPLSYGNLTYSYPGFERVKIAVKSPYPEKTEEVFTLKEGDFEIKGVLTGYSSKAQSDDPMKSFVADEAMFADQLNTLKGQREHIAVKVTQKDNALIFYKGEESYSFVHKPLVLLNGNVFMGDPISLNNIEAQSVKVVNGDDAFLLYGRSAKNGVIELQIDHSIYQKLVSVAYDEAVGESIPEQSIRTNFSDYAFWQPRLRTDKEGRATFDVTFPDDVTNWKTNFIAMNGHRQSGFISSEIKSYKPLTAQLATPRYLILGDTVKAIGKTLNYSEDDVSVETHLEVNGKKIYSRYHDGVSKMVDTITICADADTLSMTYLLQEKNGYVDGEKRDIPVFAKGMETYRYRNYYFDRDTTISLSFDASKGPVKFTVQSSSYDLWEEKIKDVRVYKYDCTEQLSSKLIALLAKKQIVESKGDRFLNNAKVKRLIRLIEERQRCENLWGWWIGDQPRLWISLHAVDALFQAEQMGYTIHVSKKMLTTRLQEYLFDFVYVDKQINALKILKRINAPVDYEQYIKKFDDRKNSSIHTKLSLIELKQLCGLDYDIKEIDTYKEVDSFGLLSFSSDSKEYTVNRGRVVNTLIAYRILKNDPQSPSEEVGSLQRFFLCNSDLWCNTYLSSLVIQTILPDLIQSKTNTKVPKLILSGGLNKTITAFPVELELDPTKEMTVQNVGGVVNIMASQKHWIENTTLKNSDCAIKTYFKDKVGNALKVGEAVKLIAQVEAPKNADYVAIHVPIPAGCSYVSKKPFYKGETHREFHKNEVTIFCSQLKAGTYEFEIELLPRYAGTFTMNPAKIEMIYFPGYNANNEMKQVIIR